MDYMRIFTDCLNKLQLLGLHEQFSIPNKYIVDVDVTTIFSLGVNINYKQFYIKPDIYAAAMWAKALNSDLTLYASIGDMVWNNQEIKKNYLMKSEQLEILRKVQSITSKWYSTSYINLLIEKLNEEFKPSPGRYRTRQSDIINSCRSTVLNLIPTLGWTNTLYFHTNYNPDHGLKGLDYFIITDGTVYSFETLLTTDRVEFLRFKQTGPNMAITYPIPWIKTKIQFDHSEEPSNVNENIDEIFNTGDYNSTKTINIRARWVDYTLERNNLQKYNRILRLLVANHGYKNLDPSVFNSGTKVTFFNYKSEDLLKHLDIVILSQPIRT